MLEMASLRLIASNLVTRSVLPTLASASRFLSINAGHRSHTSMPIDADFYDQSWPRILWFKISSISCHVETSANYRSLILDIPGSEDETDKGLYVCLNMSGIKTEDMMRTCNIQGQTNYEAGKEEMMKDGMLKVTLPNQDEFKINNMANILANDIIASFRDITTKRAWAYYDMFSDRSILGKRLCPLISMMSPINSFSIHKDETNYSLDINMDMPGEEKMKLITQGLRVSLNMPGLKRGDVKTFFDYDTFFIEGKTGTEHYITGIHLPKGISKKHNMIKKEMKEGVFYAVIPCRMKKDEIKINSLIN